MPSGASSEKATWHLPRVQDHIVVEEIHRPGGRRTVAMKRPLVGSITNSLALHPPCPAARLASE